MKVLDAYDITDATLFSSNVAEADYSAWLTGTTYAVGARVIRAATHRIYECQVAGISIIAPEADAATWRDVQPTNRWAMLGRSVAWATSNASSISVFVTPGAVGDIVLLGLAGTQVQIFSGATGATLVRTVAIPAPVAPSTTSQLVITGLGIAAGNRIGVVITGTGAVQCAHLGLGTFLDMGQTLGGPQISLTDFSRINVDDFGVISVVRRGYSRKLAGQALVTAAQADAVVIPTVERLRATVAYWSMADSLECLGGLAIVRDFRHQSEVTTTVTYSITLETLARDDLVIAPGFSGAADTALPTLPPVTGLSIAIIPGGYTLTWDKTTAAGYVGTEIRSGASWDDGALVFFGSSRQHSVFWPAVGAYTYLAKHVGLGIESDQAAGLRVTVNADGTISARVVWVTSGGVVVTWQMTSGGEQDWGDAALGYLVDTPQLGRNAATEVLAVFVAAETWAPT